MRLNQFEFLLALKQYGSFSRAASKLYIAQPSVSRAVKELETELGFQIIRRDHSGISFTSKGQVVLDDVDRIMSSITHIRSLEDNFQMEFSGEIHVSCVSIPCSSILMDALVSLNQDYPQVKIFSTRMPRSALFSSLAAGNLDLGVTQISSIEREAAEHDMAQLGLRFHPLFSDRGCFIMSTMHPLYRQPELTMRQIAGYSLVAVPDDEGHCPFEQAFMAQGYEVPTIYIDDTEYRKFIERSFSISPCSVFAAQKIRSSQNSTIGMRICKDFEWYCEIGWVHRKGELSPAQKILVHNLELCALDYQDIRFG